MLQEILKTLGLSKQESEIFMQLARLENAPASRIAQKTRIKRTTCYQLLEGLVKRNLIKRSIKYRVRYYTAISPKELALMLDKKTEPLLEAKVLLNKNLTEIEKFYNSEIASTIISVYDGYDEIKLVYDKILAEEDEEIYTMMCKIDTTNHPLKEYWEEWVQKRVNSGKKSYSFIPTEQLSEKYLQISKKETRMVMNVDSSDIEICDDLKVTGKLVSLVSQYEGRIFGITIEDEKIARMFKGIMKTLWKHYSTMPAGEI